MPYKAFSCTNLYPGSHKLSEWLESPLWCLKIDFLFLACFCVTSRSRAYKYISFCLVVRPSWTATTTTNEFCRYLCLIHGRTLFCIACSFATLPNACRKRVRRVCFRTSFRRYAKLRRRLVCGRIIGVVAWYCYLQIYSKGTKKMLFSTIKFIRNKARL